MPIQHYRKGGVFFLCFFYCGLGLLGMRVRDQLYYFSPSWGKTCRRCVMQSVLCMACTLYIVCAGRLLNPCHMKVTVDTLNFQYVIEFS